MLYTDWGIARFDDDCGGELMTLGYVPWLTGTEPPPAGVPLCPPVVPPSLLSLWLLTLLCVVFRCRWLLYLLYFVLSLPLLALVPAVVACVVVVLLIAFDFCHLAT